MRITLKTSRQYLPSKELGAMQRRLNLIYLGDEEACVKGEDGYFYVKYPEKETKEFYEAHAKINRGYVLTVELDICDRTGKAVVISATCK